MGRHGNGARFAIASVLWTAAWTVMVVALTQAHEPWPWGGVALFLGELAATATAWWALECVAGREARKVMSDLCSEVAMLRSECEELRHDREALPGILAEAVARAFAVRRVGG